MLSIKLHPIMDPHGKVKALAEEFSPKPMDSVEFGTRRQEFGAQLLQCSANDFSLKVLSCGDGGHGHI